jgi:hypothetical protein
VTTIINKYVGITHPVLAEGLNEKEYGTILQAWKHSNCIQGIHLFDECWSTNAGDGGVEHYLHCDACGMEVHINHVVVPDDKEIVIGNNKHSGSANNCPECRKNHGHKFEEI